MSAVAPANANTGFDPDAIDTFDVGNGDDVVYDLENVSEQAGFSILPPGTYDAIVDTVDFGKSQSSGNPMWTWQFKVVDPTTGRDKTLYFHTVFTETGLPRLKQVLGRIAPDMPSKIRPGHDNQYLIGRPCRVKVKNRNYDGSTRNQVVDVLQAAANSEMSFLS